MLWVQEGFALDDAGNLLTTIYIDLRDKEERSAIRGLVKGCKREHALEDGKTLLISKPARFREYGVALIRDEQEGFAREEVVTLEAETPEEAARRRATADLNDALELVGSTTKSVHRVEHSRRKSQRESFSYGKDWWIFCASIRPEDGGWDTWRETLDEDYDHVSEIGQPAKFAQALARMVTEQIGPHGDQAQLTGTSEGRAGARTKHRSQWVIHGPVVYTDRLHETIVGEEDEVRRLAACLFAKPMTHAAQREYRFVVLNGGADEETVLLNISGMMHDALAPSESGLVRPSPAPAETVGEDGAALPRPISSSTKQRYRRATVKARREERAERRVETRAPDGQVLSSDVERQESVEERIVTRDLETDDRGVQELRGAEDPEDAGLEPSVPEIGRDAGEPGDPDNEDAVAKELALDERNWNDERGGDVLALPVVHRGSGRTFKSFGAMLEDPTAPMSPTVKTWEVSACSPEEIVKSYGAGRDSGDEDHPRRGAAQAGGGKRLLACPAMHQPYLCAARRHRGQRVDRTRPFRRYSHQGFAGAGRNGADRDRTERRVCLLFQERDVREHGEQRRSVGEVILPARRSRRDIRVVRMARQGRTRPGRGRGEE